jgi:hypothetical protein
MITVDLRRSQFDHLDAGAMGLISSDSVNHHSFHLLALMEDRTNSREYSL